MKPICMPCQCFFRPKKTGYYFIEGYPIGETDDVQPGTATPDRWKPYKIWHGDIWRCEGCGAEIISGVGREPISVHHMPDFAKLKSQLGADFQVNDC